MSFDIKLHTRAVRNGDVSLAVHEVGQPGGDPLLVLHAAGFHGLTYLPVVLTL